MSSYRFYIHCFSAMKLIKKANLQLKGTVFENVPFVEFIVLVFTRMLDENVILVEFMYLVFTCMRGKSYRRRSMSLLLCSCDVFRTPIHCHYSLIIHKRLGLIFHFRFYHQGAPVCCVFGISISGTILKCIHALGDFPRALFLPVLFLQLRLQAVYLWAVLAKSDGWFQIVVFWRGH